ncbi:hypothetical protein Syun_006843 [Stephania yunnanensis]|uniref:Uncharacterized protein n=1 Tax=Stephania yunnanensis TaxID=152371 RepID=A0AAP0KZ28_9MAGN
MEMVDRPEALKNVDGVEANNADDSSRCSRGPTRRPARMGTRERADEQHQLGAVARRRWCMRGHTR